MNNQNSGKENINSLILEKLLENIKEGIHIVDETGKTLYYNEALADIEGFNREEVLGKRVYDYLENMEENSTLMKCLKNNSKSMNFIQEYNNNKGKKITSINTTVPVTCNDKVVAAIEIARDMTQLKKLNEKICTLSNSIRGRDDRYTFSHIIGDSDVLKKEIGKGIKASLSNSSVLIYGETGCGKELFAQSIHYNGIRKDKPFIAVNCAAIPTQLLEGMLFGTVKGAFTGAENKKGLLEEANKGTILLDEINSLEPYLQSKLLRILQDGYIRPLGSNKIIDIDVRVIATLNEEPEALMKSGKLRKDFYYRLSVIRINIPPLRERKEDIPQLVENFIKKYNALLSKNVETISNDIMVKFMEYQWPGNVRELKNVIEQAMNLIDCGEILTKEYFDSRFNINKNEEVFTLKENASLDEIIEDMEKKIICKIFLKNKGNLSKTARELKISRQNLQYKIKKYGIS